MKIRAIIIAFAILAFLTMSAGGYLYYSSLEEAALQELHKNIGTNVEELAKRIDLYGCDYQKIAVTLAGILLVCVAIGAINIILYRKATHEIAQRKSVEDALRLLASIVENLPEAVCVIDTNAVIVSWNSGAEKMLGYRAGEIIGKPITTVIPEELAQQELEHCLTLLNTDGYFIGYETVRLAKDGGRIPVELTAVAIRDKARNIKNYASIMVDVTDRKKAEEERLKGHTLESVGILAGGIAHDFNNLLTVILGNIAVAKMCVQPGDKAFSRLDDAEKVCEMAAELSKRLITFATGGDPVRKIAPFPGLLRKAVNSALKDSNIHAEFYLPDDLSLVAIDEGQMKQVFTNLVMNAKEAMPKGGTLTVRGENLHIVAQDSFPMREGNYVKISIKDTGSGIPAESLAKIFDPYYSTKDTYSRKGLGLGLAVCYSIIRKHDGLITAESQAGEGTTFSIYLTAADKNRNKQSVTRGFPEEIP